MLLGRFVFGLGGESLNIPIMIFLVKYFRGKELAFAQGLSISLARLVSFANAMITPMLAENISVSFAILIGCVLSVLSILAAFALTIADEKLGDDLEEDESGEIDLCNTPFKLGSVFSIS